MLRKIACTASSIGLLILTQAVQAETYPGIPYPSHVTAPGYAYQPAAYPPPGYRPYAPAYGNGNPWGGNNNWAPWNSGNNWNPWNNGGNNWAPWNSGNNGSPWNGGNNWAPWNSGNNWTPWNGSQNWGPANGMMDGLGDMDVDFDVRFSARGMNRFFGNENWNGQGWNNQYAVPQGYYPPPPPMPLPAPAVETPAVVIVAENPDLDADGVLNNFDLCANTTAGLSVDAFGCAQGASIVLRGVNFHTDSDKLTDDSIAILDRVGRTLSAHPELMVEVAGHTDSDGEADYNKDLSQRRSNIVAAYLIYRGVTPENVTAVGYGEEQPLSSNDNADGKAKNRRVELRKMNG